MNKKAMHLKKTSGFSLVELLVVLLIIGILASLGFFGYGAWRENVARTEVTSDLNGVAAAMESARNWNNGYPDIEDGAVFDGSTPQTENIFTQSKGVVLTYFEGDDKTYCVDAVSVARPDIKMSLSTTGTKSPVEGTCSDGLPAAIYALGSVAAPSATTSCPSGDPWVCGLHVGRVDPVSGTTQLTAGNEMQIAHSISCNGNTCRSIVTTLTSDSADLEVARNGSDDWGDSVTVGPTTREPGSMITNDFKARLRPGVRGGSYALTLTVSSTGNQSQTRGTGLQITFVKL